MEKKKCKQIKSINELMYLFQEYWIIEAKKQAANNKRSIPLKREKTESI